MIPKVDGLIKDSGIMLIAMAIANISLLFFHIYMSRTLGPAGFGILASFLSICFIIELPISAIQTVVAKYVSNFKIHNQYGMIRLLFFRSLQKLLPYSSLGFIVFFLSSGYVSSFLKIPSRTPVIFLGIVFFLLLIIPVVRGTLQGLQKFGYLGTNLSIDATLRLLFGFCLVNLGMGVNGALGGIALAVGVAFLAAFMPLRFLFKQRRSTESEINSSEIYAFFWPVSLALLSFAILTNVDVIVVKHFFSPLEAGYYAVLSIVGRGFLTLALAVSMVMFPKVSELETQKKDSSSILKKSLLICVLLCSVGILTCFFFPRFIILTVFGSEYLNISSLLRVFGIAISPLVLVHLLINYNLARHRTKFLYVLVFGVVFYVILLSLFHSSLKQVVLILGSVGTLTLILNIGLVVCQDEKIVRGVSI